MWNKIKKRDKLKGTRIVSIVVNVKGHEHTINNRLWLLDKGTHTFLSDYATSHTGLQNKSRHQLDHGKMATSTLFWVKNC